MKLDFGRSLKFKYKNPMRWLGLFYLKSGGVLLSHGETPHYHRRWCVSLLSSEWIRWCHTAMAARQKLL